MAVEGSELVKKGRETAKVYSHQVVSESDNSRPKTIVETVLAQYAQNLVVVKLFHFVFLRFKP